jgi:hypothetical protein
MGEFVQSKRERVGQLRRVILRGRFAVTASAAMVIAATCAGSVGASRTSAPAYFPVFEVGVSGEFASGGFQNYVYNTVSSKRAKVLPLDCDAVGFSRSGDRALADCLEPTAINGKSGFNGYYVFYPSKRKPFRLIPGNVDKSVLNAAFSPDSRTVVYAQTAGNVTGIAQHLFRIPATGGKAKQLTFGAASDDVPIFTPNGRWILFQRTNAKTIDTAIYAMPAQGGAPHLVVPANIGLLGGVSADGSTLLWRDLYAVHAQSFDDATATVTSDTPDHVILTDVSGGPDWSPDGLQIGYGRQNDLGGSPDPHAAIANADGTDERTISHDSFGHKSLVLAWLPASVAAKWER